MRSDSSRAPQLSSSAAHHLITSLTTIREHLDTSDPETERNPRTTQNGLSKTGERQEVGPPRRADPDHVRPQDDRCVCCKVDHLPVYCRRDERSERCTDRTKDLRQ